MGKSKLTLSIEKTLIEEAKKYAYETGRSLSQIIEEYLEYLVSTKWSEALSKELDLGDLNPPRDPYEIPRNRPRGFNSTEIVKQLRKGREEAITNGIERS